MAVRIAITGAEGFVGPYLADHLEMQGQNVFRLDTTNGPNLLDPKAWVECFEDKKPEVVYHLAGWSNVASSWQDPHKCFDVNAGGTLAVLEAARLNNVRRVLVVSSADVYTPQTTFHKLTEDDPTTPITPYGASKLASEVVARQYWLGHQLEIVIARPFNHIGPGQRGVFVAATFAEKIAQIEKYGGVLEHGDLNSERDFTDVRDVVKAYRLLAEKAEPGETYNICSGTSTKIGDLLSSLISLSTAEVETRQDPKLLRPVDCPYRVGSAKKLLEATGWKPDHELSETLSDLLEHKRQQT